MLHPWYSECTYGASTILNGTGPYKASILTSVPNCHTYTHSFPNTWQLRPNQLTACGPKGPRLHSHLLLHQIDWLSSNYPDPPLGRPASGQAERAWRGKIIPLPQTIYMYIYLYLGFKTSRRVYIGVVIAITLYLLGPVTNRCGLSFNPLPTKSQLPTGVVLALTLYLLSPSYQPVWS